MLFLLSEFCLCFTYLHFVCLFSLQPNWCFFFEFPNSSFLWPLLFLWFSYSFFSLVLYLDFLFLLSPSLCFFFGFHLVFSLFFLLFFFYIIIWSEATFDYYLQEVVLIIPFGILYLKLYITGEVKHIMPECTCKQKALSYVVVSNHLHIGF